VLFGASTPLAKILLGSVDPWLLAGLLYLGSGFGLAILLIGRRLTGRSKEAPLRPADIPWLAAVVFFGGVLGPILLMSGLSLSTASAASLLLNLEGLATMVIAWVFLREHVDRRLFIGAMAIFAGSVVLTWEGGAWDFNLGAILVAAACISWGIDKNLTRKLSGADPVVTSAIKGLGAGTVNLLLAVAGGARIPNLETVGAAALIGLFGYGMSLVLFVLALRHLGTARTGAYYSTAPFIGAALAVFLLGDPVTAQLALAAVLMAAGVWLHLTERHEHTHAHEPMAHAHRHVHDEHHQHEHGPNDPPGEPHSHWHEHPQLVHWHAHYPDLHHRHRH
jgi:drug/metabolite transporter (DMT)-like permease